MDPELTNGQKDDLERLIDRHGIANVLNAIGEISGEKAAHIASMWQDTTLSKRWDKLATWLGEAAVQAEGL